jgi:ligand-binding SRPBCC domain-containing protein
VRLQRLDREQTVPRRLDEVFDFFSQARNLELITPPWLGFEVLKAEPEPMRQGTLISYRLRLHGMPLRWQSRIEEWEPGRAFVDTQVRGPYRLWRHRHEFEEVAHGGTLVRDRVDYSLPLGPLGSAVHAAFVRRDLGRIFDFRREAVERLLG